MMMMRNFQRTVQRVDDAARSEHVDPPKGYRASLVSRLRKQRRKREAEERLRRERDG